MPVLTMWKTMEQTVNKEKHDGQVGAVTGQKAGPQPDGDVKPDRCPEYCTR